MTLQADQAGLGHGACAPVAGAWSGSEGHLAASYPHRYAVLDVETTGFSARRDRVLQVAVTLLDARGREEGSWSTLVDPECDPGPVHVHGITSERLVGAPRFADVAGYLAGLLVGRVFVAHNAAFDWGFVTAEMARAGQALPVERRLCTRNLARRLDLPVPNLKLSTLAAHWGVVQLQAHDAADDTRVLVEVLRHCLLVAVRHGVEIPFTTGEREPTRAAELPAGAAAFLAPVPLPAQVTAPVPAAAGAAAGPWVGRRVLVLGGPHEVAVRARAGVRALGGAAAVTLSAATTHVVVLPGADDDPRSAVARRLGLVELHAGGLPAGPGPVTLALPPEPRRWLLEARWARLADPVVVDVVAWRTGVLDAGADGVRRDATTLGSAEASVALDHLGDGVDGVLLTARLPAGTTFGQVGPVEFTLRSPDGAVVASTTLDGAAEAAELVLGGVFLTGSTWWFRTGG